MAAGAGENKMNELDKNKVKSDIMGLFLNYYPEIGETFGNDILSDNCISVLEVYDPTDSFGEVIGKSNFHGYSFEEFESIESVLQVSDNAENLKCELSWGYSVLESTYKLLQHVRNLTFDFIMSEETTQAKALCLSNYIGFYAHFCDYYYKGVLSQVLANFNEYFDYIIYSSVPQNGYMAFRLEPLLVEIEKYNSSFCGRDCTHAILQLHSLRLSNRRYPVLGASQNMHFWASIHNLCDIVLSNWASSGATVIPEVRDLLYEQGPTTEMPRSIDDINLGTYVDTTITACEHYADLIESYSYQDNAYVSLKKELFTPGRFINSDDISMSRGLFNYFEKHHSRESADDLLVYDGLIRSAYASIEAIRWLCEALKIADKSKYSDLARKYKLIVTEKKIRRLRNVNRRLIRSVYTSEGENNYEDAIEMAKMEIIEKLEDQTDSSMRQVDNLIRLLNSVNQKDLSSFLRVSAKLTNELPSLPEDLRYRLENSIEQLYKSLKSAVENDISHSTYKNNVKEIIQFSDFQDVLSDEFISNIATGKFLFAKFNENNDDMNYNFLVLPFLESLEVEVNDIMYKPYIIEEVMNNYNNISIDEQNDHWLIIEGNRREKSRVQNEAFGPNIRVLKNGKLPASIELGSVGYLLKYIDDSGDLAPFIDDQYPDCNIQYMKELGDRVLDEYVDIRNDAAHGSRIISLIEATTIKDALLSIHNSGELTAIIDNIKSNDN